MLDSRLRQLHENTILKAQRYLAAEAELLQAIIEIDRHRLYEKWGETHLTPYCVKYLKLSEDVAGMFVRVARKSRQVPALAAAVDEGLQVSKARTIATVINADNHDLWIEKAQTLTRDKLEREVAAAQPLVPKPEKAKPVGPNRIRIEFEVTDDEADLLVRARDLLSQKENSFSSLGEAVVAAVRDWVDREDPVRKAERANQRQAKKPKRSESATRKIGDQTPATAGKIGNQDAATGSKSKSNFEADADRNTGDEIAMQSGEITKIPTSKSPSHPPRDGWHARKPRKPLPARVLHQVHQRDGGACRIQHADSSRCGSRKWIHLHHVQPKSEGGADRAENLVTVCGPHHRLLHRSPEEFHFDFESDQPGPKSRLESPE